MLRQEGTFVSIRRRDLACLGDPAKGIPDEGGGGGKNKQKRKKKKKQTFEKNMIKTTINKKK